MRHTAKDRPTGGLLLYIYLHLCPVNVFKSFKIQDLSNYKPQFIIETNHYCPIKIQNRSLKLLKYS